MQAVRLTAGIFLFYATVLAGTMPSLASPLHGTLETAQGPVIHYSFDQVSNAEGTLVLAQGSGCAPGFGNPNLDVIRQAFPNFSALIVEKTGVTPASSYADANCPAEFWDSYTLSQRVSHYSQVIQVLALKSEELVLIGGSEGGLAMAQLARALSPRATILFSSGLGTSFGQMVLATVPPEGHPTVTAAFDRARANPDSSEIFAGSTERFWADILDYVPKTDMLETDTQFLVVQGSADTLNPAQLAHTLVSEFAQAENCRLTYWEFAGLDHALANRAGETKLGEIAQLAHSWITLSPNLC